MEVVIPTMDFDLNNRSYPSISAPSTPKRFGEHYFSAPTSPSRISEFYRQLEDLCMITDDNSMRTSESSFGIPFDWEEKPGTPKSTKSNQNTDDFAFDFCEELEKTSRSAEELFDGGKIKPLKPPPRLQYNNGSEEYTRKSIPSPKSPIGKRIIHSAFSPKQKKHENPFDSTSKGTVNERGRGRQQALPSSKSGRRTTRSLSPLRVSEYPWVGEQVQSQENAKQPSITNSKSALSTTSSSSSLFGRWKFKDLLLFRSASEGRASGKDPLKKYATLFKKQEEIKHSSFRSTDSFGSGSGSSRRRAQVSAHELHYTKNKAASEDLRKKTFLPYKQGILGLAFSPAVHAITNGFGSLTKG